jgi:ribosomal protein S18 acetylase RimI-like enzyme
MAGDKRLTESISLRKISAADESFLRGLYLSTREREMANFPLSDDQKAAFIAMQFAAQTSHYASSYPNAEFSIIEYGDVPVGRITVDRAQLEICLVDIALQPEFQRQEIGRSLIEMLQSEAREAGQSLRLHVEITNTARRLYDRLGFTEVGNDGVYCEMLWQA